MGASAVKVNSEKSNQSAGKDVKRDVMGLGPRREAGPSTELAWMMARDGEGPSMEGLAGELASMPLVRRQSTVLSLQRTRGNAFVQRLAIQAKLTVGPAGDRFEREADHVADQVMRMTETPNPVQRQEDEEEIQTKPLAASITPLLQRFTSFVTSPLQRQGEEEEIQTKSALSGGSFDVGSAFESRLSATHGGGSPLPDIVRRQMERGFGADFGGVRVHAGSEAAQLNSEVSAQAFTHGQNIYLGEGRTNLGSSEGQRLLAHELTHVLQQNPSTVERDLAGKVSKYPMVTTTQINTLQRKWGHPLKRYDQAIGYLNNLGVNGGEVRSNTNRLVDGHRISLGKLGKGMGNQERDALKALLLCLCAFGQKKKIEDAKEIYAAKGTNEIDDAIRSWWPITGKSDADVANEAGTAPNTGNYDPIGRRGDFKIPITCYNSVVYWAFKAGVVSLRFMNDWWKTANPQTTLALLLPGPTEYAQGQIVPAGHIVGFFIFDHCVHFALSLGDGTCAGTNLGAFGHGGYAVLGIDWIRQQFNTREGRQISVKAQAVPNPF